MIRNPALLIRNLFLKTPLPRRLSRALKDVVNRHFKETSVVVRSSSPDEDAAQTSFAGLHASFVNINGIDAIIKHIRLVWASLWSDAALLYRQEIGIDVESSVMGVVIQEIVTGTRSGVVFTRDPNDETRGIIESVYGLNQGLVDGTIEPDRWMIDRSTHKVLSHHPAKRAQQYEPAAGGTRMADLTVERSAQAPLTNEDAVAVFQHALQIERTFEKPQDVEWTIQNDTLYVLQSRPITTLTRDATDDKRSWYLSLHRSFENLKQLRQKIEGELIPEMTKTAEALAEVDLAGLSDSDLLAEIVRRSEINTHWNNVYWADFIPFAHGMRFFGQVYNDTVQPEDPYEFMRLLGQPAMQSTARNDMLAELAGMIRGDPALAEKLRRLEAESVPSPFTQKVEQFIETYGDLSCPVTGGTQCGYGPEALIRLLLEMAAHPSRTRPDLGSEDIERLRTHFLSHFDPPKQKLATELIDLARASYRLRDDDNIYLGKIEAQMLAAVHEGERRPVKSTQSADQQKVSKDLKQILHTISVSTKKQPANRRSSVKGFHVKARQLLGQPANGGIARGQARVILSTQDLIDFKYGEILVCEAVDPNMTYIVPLAAGVVEKRGGMLIHGAIIAREYGLPCVTGVTEAMEYTQTGVTLTVDGFLGIVTLD